MVRKPLTRKRVISYLNYTITGLDWVSKFKPSFGISLAIVVLIGVVLWLELGNTN